MVGIATARIVLSITIMLSARHSTVNASQRLGCPSVTPQPYELA